eukprot:c16182_g1_i2.p1 GENE.c16182_g1_i2~~c16182_g1_i2.p1  ORF type:complete len:471 (+),score=98.10 c16182_g1_i2:111-1523(+)
MNALNYFARALLFLTVGSRALRVLAPLDLAATIESPIMNIRVGLQTDSIDPLLLEGVLERVDFGNACNIDLNVTTNSSGLPIVYVIDIPWPIIPGEILHEIVCLQADSRTSAVLVLAQLYPKPGAALFDSRLFPSDPSQIHIHVLHAASSKEMAAVMTYLTNDSPDGPVHVQLEISSNPWQDEMWDTTTFFVLFRVILTGMNLGIALFAFYRLTKQAQGVLLMYTNPTFQNAMIVPAMVVMVAEISACLCRGVYFWIGPLHSTLHLSYAEDEFLGTVTFGTGNLVTYISVAYVIYATTFVNPKRWYFLARTAIVIGVASFLMNVVVIFSDPLSLAQLQAMIGAFLTWVAAMSFLVSGKRLLNVFKHRDSHLASSQKNRKRQTIIWILVASFAQLFEVGTLLAAALMPMSFRDPGQYMTIAAITMFSLTVASAAHCAAFNPNTKLAKAKPLPHNFVTFFVKKPSNMAADAK